MADRIIAVEPVTGHLRDFCRDYIIETDRDADPDIDVRLTGADVGRERELSGSLSSDAYLETLALARKVATAFPDFDTFMFHGSCIAVDGEGICFTAPSGVGKSTHANLWKEQFKEHVTYINDDKPFIRIGDDTVTAYGSPWNGARHLGGNISCPLKVICILKRDDTDHIERISAEEAYPVLLGQTYRPHSRAALGKTLELVDRLGSLVSLYSLGCTMDLQAAAVAYEGIMEGQRDEIKGRIYNV